MQNKIKMAVLNHLKSLMDDKMSEDIPSHMKIESVHKFPPETTIAEGEDEKGDPMAMLAQEEGEEHFGIEPKGEMDLPDLKDLKPSFEKPSEENMNMDKFKDSAPHDGSLEHLLPSKDKEEPSRNMGESKYPLFAMNKKEKDPEDDNHSFIAQLKRAKKKLS